MKYLLLSFLVFFSALADAQTTHIEKGEIVYKGGVEVKGADQAILFDRIQKAVPSIFKSKEMPLVSKASLTTNGVLTLASPYTVIKTIRYRFSIKTEKERYSYVLDSVFLVVKERGGKTTTVSSADLYKGMEESGAVSLQTEAVLNEIDMRIQRLLALLRRETGGKTK
ncbi:MAG: hypothetical protein JWP88_876 [Flaviaesturariibacter sp.]|nr:hypothetical protein [Flaviaesturariibacter sp.]